MHRDRLGDHFQESGDIRESSSVLWIAGHLRWKSHLEKIRFEILLKEARLSQYDVNVVGRVFRLLGAATEKVRLHKYSLQWPIQGGGLSDISCVFLSFLSDISSCGHIWLCRTYLAGTELTSKKCACAPALDLGTQYRRWIRVY